MKMEVYFRDYEDTFTDTRKISATLVNMKEGQASRWAKPLLKKLLDRTEYEALASWDNFKKAFLLAFGDPIKRERATENIQKLVQTRSTSEYASEFRILMEELEWDERALIDRFKAGLKETVKQELMRMTVLMNVSRLSLEEWIEYATRTDDILFATRTKREAQTKGRAATTNNTPAETKKVPQSTIDRRMKKGKCIKCGRRGHRARRC